MSAIAVRPDAATRPVSDVSAWPSLSRAARYLGVDKATLSRRSDLDVEHVGQQETRISPATVIRLAREYRRRVVDEVAYDLVELARHRAPDQVAAVEQDIDAVLAEPSSGPKADQDEFLKVAAERLPSDLYELVVQAVANKRPSAGVLADHEPMAPAPSNDPGRETRSQKRAPSGPSRA